MHKQATISSKGRITVQLEVQKMLGVRAGDKRPSSHYRLLSLDEKLYRVPFPALKVEAI
jgi:hypothetical protein